MNGKYMSLIFGVLEKKEFLDGKERQSIRVLAFETIR